MIRLRLLAAVLFVLAFVHPSFAQGFLAPSVVTTVTSPSAVGSKTKPGVSLALGGFGGIVGGETEVAYYPALIDDSANALAKSKVVTFSADTLVGPKIGMVRIYGAVGAGDLYLNVTKASSIVVPNPQSVSNNYFAFNVGGGAMGFIASHLGVRGDVRYFKAFGFKAADAQTSTFTLDKFDFWRLSGGVVLKF